MGNMPALGSGLHGVARAAAPAMYVEQFDRQANEPIGSGLRGECIAKRTQIALSA